MEPQLPGACETVISTCGFWNKDALCGERDTLAALFASCDTHHRQAKQYLACTGAFLRSTHDIIDPRLDHAKLRSAAAAMVRRYCPGKGSGKFERQRLLTAVTPRGVLMQNDTLSALGCIMIPIDDRYGIASGVLLEYIRALLVSSGHGIICCPDPISGLYEAIIVPECSTAFVAGKVPVPADGARVTHCTRFLTQPLEREDKRTLAENARRINDMIALACDRLAMALAVHDKLESVYVGCSDFSGIDRISEEIGHEIFGTH